MFQLSIFKKIMLLLLAFSLLLAGSMILYFQYNVSFIKTDVYTQEMKILQKNILEKEHIKLNSARDIVLSMCANMTILDNMYNEKREPLFEQLSLFKSVLKKNTAYKNPLLQLVDSTGLSYIKSWNFKSYGANLLVRSSVQKVIEEKKLIYGSEMTRGGLMLVATCPLIGEKEEDETIDDAYLGSVDFILKYDSLVYKRENPEDNRDLLVLVKKNLLPQTSIVKNPEFIGDYYIDLKKKNINTQFLKAVQKINVEELIRRGYITDKNYFYTYAYINDINEKQVGMYLIGKDINAVNFTIDKTADIVKSQIYIIAIILIIMIFISGILFRIRQIL